MSRKNDKPCILVVDDNPSNLQLICTLLKEAGYRLAVAQNAWDCFVYLEKREPDLILLDVLMPGLNGLDICRAIKANEQTGDIPVLFVTTLHDPCDLGFKKNAHESGCTCDNSSKREPRPHET